MSEGNAEIAVLRRKEKGCAPSWWRSHIEKVFRAGLSWDLPTPLADEAVGTQTNPGVSVARDGRLLPIRLHSKPGKSLNDKGPQREEHRQQTRVDPRQIHRGTSRPSLELRRSSRYFCERKGSRALRVPRTDAPAVVFSRGCNRGAMLAKSSVFCKKYSAVPRVFLLQGRAIRSDSVRNDTRRVAARTRLFFRQYLPPHPSNRASIAGGGDVSEPGRAWITDAGAHAILTTGFLRPMLSERASQTEGGCDWDRCPIDDAPIPVVR
jgi:hypothetical protein